jgi:hypothetical protein
MSGSLTFPLACFVGLAVGGVEVTVAGYTRQAATLAYCADGITIANTTSLQWPHATAFWGAINTVTLWDTTGTLFGTLPTVTPVLIAMYDIARISAGGIAIVHQEVVRPFGSRQFGASAYGAVSSFLPAAVMPSGFLFVGSSSRGFGMGGFGVGGYAGDTDLHLVPLERAFDQSQVHVCAPGVWAPGPFALAA